MLVLARGVGSTITIGDDITITVVRIGPDRVRLGIDAPDGMVILRDDAIDKEPRQAHGISEASA